MTEKERVPIASQFAHLMHLGRIVVTLCALLVLAASASLASTSSASAACPNEAFRTGPSAGLPDCRAYELASPVDKNGGEVEGWSGQFRAASDGSGITFSTAAGTTIPSPVGGTQTFPVYLARKSGETWATQRLLAPPAYGDSFASDWLGSTPDLRYSLVQAGRLGFPEPTAGLGLFLIDTMTNEIEMIVPWEKEPDPEPGGFQYAFDGASQDGSRIFFESMVALTPGSHESKDNLYMWDRETKEVSLLGILPQSEGGQEPAAGTFGGAYEWYSEFSTVSEGGALDELAVEAANAISPSGDQIYFTAAQSGQLYLRRGLTGSTPSTLRVSAPQPGVTDPNEPQPAAFQEATPSGSRAFFLSSGKLTADATTGPADEGKDLYRWDAASEELVDVAPDTSGAAGAEVQGLLGISADGSSGYFVAKGELNGEGTAGSPNLYRFVETAGGGFTNIYIATLHTTADPKNVDKRNWSPRTYSARLKGVGAGKKEWKTSRTSADGGILVFTSTASLTGYDNVNSTPGSECPESEEHCAEIYRYAAATAQLTCVSCQPQAQPPLGSSQLQSYRVTSFEAPNTAPNVQIPRNLSADGNRLFFETPDPLVAADTNGDEGCPYFRETTQEAEPECEDVYEWQAPGTGSCQVEEVNGGCLYLLSTGKSDSGSFLLDASTDGSNVFIATKQQLVPVDRDVATDAYDVAVDGGLAWQQVVPEQPCEAEACRGLVSTSSPAGNPASSRFEGPGNPKHKHHKKKHHKKKHHKKKHRHQKSAGGGK